MKSQEDRREAQRQISAIQQRLHELHAELDRIPKGDDKYLALITQEHMVIREERKLREDFQQFEKEERENFATLSNTLRDSHEKERAQAEKTKYWSIIGSILGTMVGVIGTTINNHIRMNELRNLVKDTAKPSSIIVNKEELSKQFSSVINRDFSSVVERLHLQSFPEEKWKDIQSSFAAVTKTMQDQENMKQELNQKLDAILANGNLKIDDEYGNRQFIIGETEIRTIVRKERENLTRLIIVCAAVIPLCTLMVNKFINF